VRVVRLHVASDAGVLQDDWDIVYQCQDQDYYTCTDNLHLDFMNTWCLNVGGWCQSDANYSGTWVDCWQLYGQYNQENPAGCDADPACHVACGYLVPVRRDSIRQLRAQEVLMLAIFYAGSVRNATNSAWCRWNQNEWGAWCESLAYGVNSCWNQYNEGDCISRGCEWISRYCDPQGFGKKLASKSRRAASAAAHELRP